MNKKGFTLIELLIVVAIIGIIAAIAIPNLLVAIQKGKQKATMADMKTIGTACSAYMTDFYIAPTTLEDDGFGRHRDFYMPHFPIQDGWGGTWNYLRSRPDELYTIHSFGKNRTPDPVSVGSYVVTSLAGFNNDIVFQNGSFVWGPRVK